MDLEIIIIHHANCFGGSWCWVAGVQSTVIGLLGDLTQYVIISFYETELLLSFLYAVCVKGVGYNDFM